MKRKAITKKNFLNAVKQEIDSLKQNATSEEINRLNIHLFNPDEMNNCIYGQLTNSCTSNRAKQLMETSCIKVFDVKRVTLIEGSNFEKIVYETKVNNNKNQTWIGESIDSKNYLRDLYYLSALETYILLENANNKDIIKYLKGETTELNLDTIK